MSTSFISRSPRTAHKSFLIVALIALISMSLVATFVNRADAAVDTCTWTGDISTDMNDPGNWDVCDNGNAPEAGDTLLFPPTASNKNLSIDNFVVAPQFLTITGSGYSFNRTGVQELTITGASVGMTTSNDVDFNVPVNITGTNATLRAATGEDFNFDGAVDLTLTGELNVGAATYEGGAYFNAAITGSATQFIAVENAFAEVTGAGNTYTATTVGAESGGSFRCVHLSCFGDAANDIYTGGGAVALLVGGTFSNDVVTSAPTSDISSLEAFEDILMTGDVTVSSTMRIIQVGSGTKTFEFASIGTISIASGQSLGVFGGNSTNAIVELNGTITGTGDGIQVNQATVEISGANSFDGGVGVGSEGIVRALGTTTALGDNTFTSSVADGGALIIDQMGVSATLDWPLSLAGDGPAGQGALSLASETDLTLSGDITINDNTTIGNNTACSTTHDLALTGVITGVGNLSTYVNQIPCTITIGGGSPNSYLGDHYHVSGYLNLDKDLAVPSFIILQPDGSTASTVIELGSGLTNVIGDGLVSDGSVAGDEYYNIFEDETVSELHYNTGANLNICRGANFTVDQIVESTFAGIFGQPGGCGAGTFRFIIKEGTGSLTLTADDPTDTSTIFTVNEGTLINNGNRSATPVQLNGGTLKGSGSTGDVEGVSGRFNAGTSPGCATLATLTMQSGFVFDEEIAGVTACSGYDQTTVTGAAVLGSATLNITLTTTPATGTVFTILNAGSISGTFNGLADGAIITVSGKRFQIDYTSTAVTLTALANGDLATTGSDSLNSFYLALMIMFAGFGLVVVSRKRILLK